MNRRLTRRAALGALLAAVLVAGGAQPAPASMATLPAYDVTPADLAKLRQRLEELTRQAEAGAEAIALAASRTSNLRVVMTQLAEEHDRAVAALHDRVREMYMYGDPNPLLQLMTGGSPTELVMARRGFAASARSDEELIAAVQQDSERARELKRQAEKIRDDLLRQAEPVFAAQEQARLLLAEAEMRFATDQAAMAALRQQRARLDAASSTLTYAVAPAVTARGRRAQAAEEPVIRLLESTPPSQIPPGYRATGVVIEGIASWYGPGFVGNPTASGSPYDPERLTAAMLPPVKLGTVVRVTSSDGLSINVLVNDRGPFGKGRVIDLSRAGSRMLGFDGLKKVRVELLEPYEQR